MPGRPTDREEAKKWLIGVTAVIIQYITLVMQLYLSPLYWKQDYHTSKLSGNAWTQELIYGHPDRIYTELGMRLHVFLVLLAELRLNGLEDTKYITLEESLAIFLYMCVTGLSFDHVAERFQHSKSTISEYISFALLPAFFSYINIRHFHRILDALSAPEFYDKYVQLPTADDPVPPEILSNKKWYPFFEDVLGALDGTHINCCLSAADRQAARDRKGGVTQNCLAVVSMSMQFLYFVGGWEGCAADATMYTQ
jgi:hypothetical protein